MLRIGDASFIEQGYTAMVASSDELQGEASPLQTQIVTSDSFEQQMLRYSVQSPEDLHDAIMDQKCMIPSAWLALSYRDEKLAGITACLLAKSLARNEYLQYASDQRRWIYERATTIAPELRNDFRLLYGSNQLPFDDLEWMPKNDDLKFDLIQRCIGKIEMQDWAPSDDAGWRLLLEWHRCQANSLVDRTLLDAQYQSSRAISLENLPTLAEKIPAEKKELVWLASLITFAPNWGTEILQKQDFRYACMQVQAMNFLYDHSPDIASLIDQVIIEDRTLDDLFAHGQLGDYFWRDYLRYDSKACIEALRKRSKIDLNLDEASLQYRIERKHLLIRDLMLSLRDFRNSPSR